MNTAFFMLGMILAGGILAIAAVVFCCIWIYKDCKSRGGNAVLWVVICLAASPVIGILIYLIAGRKEEKVPCQSCGRMIDRQASFCAFCGYRQEAFSQGRADLSRQPKKRGQYGLLIAAGISLVMMVAVMIGTVIVAVTSDGAADTLRLNSGYVVGSLTTGGSEDWHVRYAKASKGYRYYKTMKLENPQKQFLSIRVSCEGEGLTLRLAQGEHVEQLEISGFSDSQPYSLNGFEEGQLELCLQADGASHVNCRILLW